MFGAFIVGAQRRRLHRFISVFYLALRLLQDEMSAQFLKLRCIRECRCRSFSVHQESNINAELSCSNVQICYIEILERVYQHNLRN